MDFRVSSYSMVNNISFKSKFGRKIIKNLALGVAATTLLTSSCINKNNNTSKDEFVADTTYNEANNIQKSYHYFPTEDGSVDATNYSWVETIFPDGKILRDSFGYNITISPKGERTVVHTTIDECGNKTTTTVHPDGNRNVHIDYKLDNPSEILYVEKNYRKDGTLKDNKYYNEIPLDSFGVQRSIEQSFEIYDEHEVLLAWVSNVADSARNKKYNKYDKLGRLIYDDIKNERFKYSGKSKIPRISVAYYDDCRRITLYNKDGSVQKTYFKASNGTITNQDEFEKEF